MSDTQYVIIGSGIIGLYTAYSLIDKGIPGSTIKIKAQYLPGDQSTHYTSPWAGGNFSCISGSDQQTLSFDKYTYCSLEKLQQRLGGNKCGLDRLPSTEYWDFEPPREKIDSLKEYLHDFKILTETELAKKNAVYGISFKTWNFNCPVFLKNFQDYLSRQGVIFERVKLAHILDAFPDSTTSTTTIVFNCTGIGAASLGGVQDDKVYPTRGQVVVIRAPHIKENRLRWGRTNKDTATYIIPRPNSNHQVILGGFVQNDNWTGDTFEYETQDILERTLKLMPELAPSGEQLEIIRIAAGLRPSRHGGVRIEKESLTEHNKIIIHNYGAAGYGYQAGLGMANKATQLALAPSSSKL